MSGDSQWQPIETAPKDGTEIIGMYFNVYEPGFPPTVYGPWTVAFRRGKWESSWDGERVLSYMSDFGSEYKSPEPDPTHWMPMPAPLADQPPKAWAEAKREIDKGWER